LTPLYRENLLYNIALAAYKRKVERKEGKKVIEGGKRVYIRS